MDHGAGHPCLHAALDAPRDERDAVARQLAFLDRAMAALAALGPGAGAPEPLIAEAAHLISAMYERGKGSACSCRIAPWYRGALVDLQRAAVRLLGERKGVERVPVTWRPM